MRFGLGDTAQGLSVLYLYVFLKLHVIPTNLINKCHSIGHFNSQPHWTCLGYYINRNTCTVHCKLVDQKPMAPGNEQAEFSDNGVSVEMHIHWTKDSVFIKHIFNFKIC